MTLTFILMTLILIHDIHRQYVTLTFNCDLDLYRSVPVDVLIMPAGVTTTGSY